jgi:two-component system, cell cycle sensor histidine kinase and response regulator CckA
MPIVQGINKNTPKTALDSLVNGNVKSKNKKILLVEDNPDVLKICSIVLEKEGYTIVKYDNADEAINYIAKNDSIDLLVTDANLPGKSGAELAIEFKKFCTNGKIIVISGFDQDKIGQYFPRESVFMSKPLALSDFTKKVNNILNKL